MTVFAGFTALVGALASGGDVRQRLLSVFLRPLGAAGMLRGLVLRDRLATTTILAVMALLTANVIADLGAAQRVAADRSGGRGFEAASRALEEGLQGDRRSVARGVNAIWKRQQQARERQRGPERDYGPSR